MSGLPHTTSALDAMATPSVSPHTVPQHQRDASIYGVVHIQKIKTPDLNTHGWVPVFLNSPCTWYCPNSWHTLISIKHPCVCETPLSVCIKKCLCYSLHKICECPWHLIYQIYYLEKFFSILTNFLKLCGVQQSAKQEVHVHTNPFHHFDAESLHFFRLLFIMGIQACWSCTSICRN